MRGAKRPKRLHDSIEDFILCAVGLYRRTFEREFWIICKVLGKARKGLAYSCKGCGSGLLTSLILCRIYELEFVFTTNGF